MTDQFLEMRADLLSEEKEAPVCLIAVKTLIVPILKESGKKTVRRRGLVVCQMKWSRDRMSERWRGLDHIRDLVRRSPCDHRSGTAEGHKVQDSGEAAGGERTVAVGSLCPFAMSVFHTAKLKFVQQWD